MKKGFIDLQVNGYMGVDFSAPGLTLDEVRLVVTELRERKTLAFCPTVITSSWEVYESNLPVLAEAMWEPDLRPHLLGIHLEGPFISPKDGARGAHPLDCTAPPSIESYERLRELADDSVSLLTLAPELEGAAELIRHVSHSGVRVSLGHHLADADRIRRACREGATASTHLGNGIPNLIPRHPNPIWDQLDCEQLKIMMITDGHHLPDCFIRVVTRLTSPDRRIVVSDSAPIGGYPPGKYETLGQEVVLETSGKLWNPVGDHLVGSSACMAECMNYLASLGLLNEDELWAVGYSNPLDYLGLRLDEHVYASLPDLKYDGIRFQ
ncbi:MAG: N-acetylglucosamine-6-phosphate deacetylase [Acidobacteriota bacterium]|nr:MAG: N-acetylglucosamine-6-phosphate deacetylase [Acidobacteriota bacterium]